MLRDKKLNKLKEEYINIKIPNRLDEVVNDALNSKKNTKSKKWIYTAASLGIAVGAINISSSFADTLQEIPIVGNIVKLVNFSNYRIKENGFDINIKSPKIEGLKNEKLEYKLNKEFESQGKELYNQYLKEVEQLKHENIDNHKMITSWYDIKTDNEQILSIGLYLEEIQASSYREIKYYNIDKKSQEILTLEGMFGSKDYIKIISENIKKQMKERMKDSDKVYWLNDKYAENFDRIDKDQNFYINDNNELVISFNKYEVAPGYMGVQEFIIPNEIVYKLLN